MQCEKILLKAKLLAEKHEKYESLLELLKWERTTIFSNARPHDVKQRLDALYNERKVVIAKMENTSAYSELADKIYSLSATKVVIRSNDDIPEFKKIMRHPLLQDESKAITKDSKRFFYYTHAFFCNRIGDKKKSYNYQKKIVELLASSSREEIQERPYVHLNNIYNLALSCYDMAKYDEVFDVLKKMRHLAVMLGRKCTEDIKAKIFSKSYGLELSIYLAACQFEKCIAIISDIEQGMELFKGRIKKQHEMVFNFNCAYIYFIEREYHKALTCNNKIINDTMAADIRHDIYSDAQLLNLLIHYELGNEDLLESVVKSTYRYLHKKNRLYKTETAILNFIRTKVPSFFTAQERIAAFKELKTELEEITKDPFEKNVLKDIDYIAWLESKIEGKGFAEVLKEHLRVAKGRL